MYGTSRKSDYLMIYTTGAKFKYDNQVVVVDMFGIVQIDNEEYDKNFAAIIDFKDASAEVVPKVDFQYGTYTLPFSPKYVLIASESSIKIHDVVSAF